MRNSILFILFVLLLDVKGQVKTMQMHTKINGGVILEDGSSTTFWGFGYYLAGSPNKIFLPGPLLKFYENDSVHIVLHNLSPEGHTMHLHGMDVDQANDGAPHTSYEINTNDSGTYAFRVHYPGSYFYHCHVMSVHHLAMGMYGMLVAKNMPDTNLLYEGGPGFNKSYTFLNSDMDRDWNDSSPLIGPMNLFEANYFMVNGKSGTQLFSDTVNIIQATANDSICLHIGNIGYGYVTYNFPNNLNAKIYQSDARIMPSPIRSDTLQIFPGERYEVILKPNTTITDYITVNYHHVVNGQLSGTNFIGINNYTHPLAISEKNMAEKSWKIYPNPNQQHAVFTIESQINDRIYISNPEGKILNSFQLKKGKNTIECVFPSKGVYYLFTNLGESEKIIIE